MGAWRAAGHLPRGTGEPGTANPQILMSTVVVPSWKTPPQPWPWVFALELLGNKEFAGETAPFSALSISSAASKQNL